MKRRCAAPGALAALALAACASVPPAFAPSIPLSRLPGWSAEDHAAAFALVQQVCEAHSRPPLPEGCSAVVAEGRLDETAARRFLEARYRAVPPSGEGLLTAYFSPAFPARTSPGPEFSAPVRPPPPDAFGAGDRAAIEAEPAPDALAWMRPEDLFVLQVQGSGRLLFPGGRSVRAVFAGSNGRTYTALSGPMVEKGFLQPKEASADAVYAWLAAHRGPEADAVIRLDRRYVFFRSAPDGSAEPAGAAGVPLVPGRSLAIDPAAHAFFELLWIDAEDPILAGARPTYRRLAAAMDVGGAIQGPSRADLYLGQGPAAGAEAARVRHRLTLYRIIPAGRPPL